MAFSRIFSRLARIQVVRCVLFGGSLSVRQEYINRLQHTAARSRGRGKCRYRQRRIMGGPAIKSDTGALACINSSVRGALRAAEISPPPMRQTLRHIHARIAAFIARTTTGNMVVVYRRAALAFRPSSVGIARARCNCELFSSVVLWTTVFDRCRPRPRSANC